MSSRINRFISSLNEPAKPFATWQIVVALSLFALSLTVYTSAETFTLSFYQRLLGGRLTEEQILEQYRVAEKYKEASVALAPVVVLIRALFSASVIQALILILGFRSSFDSTFRTALLCSPILLIQGMAEQSTMLASATYSAYTSYIPFSLARSGCCYDGDSQFIIEILGRINVFEGVWVGAMSYLLFSHARLLPRIAFGVVGTYWGASGLAAACINQLLRA